MSKEILIFAGGFIWATAFFFVLFFETGKERKERKGIVKKEMEKFTNEIN